ncbi:MAG TPA: nickel pincer cofactor biosynthesis protein LarC [Gemmataceae bacterium]|nr:nickel pincer cofactor biosynthesis protein LarC [Gemmataceae bacterium]
MRVAHFDCFSGISGDMTLAALVDAGVDREAIAQGLNSLGLPIRLIWEQEKRCGISGTHLQVEVNEEPQHRFLPEIEDTIAHGKLTVLQRDLALGIFRRLAQAEARVHGIPVEKVHFHEVGALDSITDIVGSAIGIDLLGVEHISSRSVPPGSGSVKCAHGLMPVPAPATAFLLENVPLATVPVKGEMTTPTGAAILTTVVKEWTEQPSMTISKIGHGLGTRDYPDWPNVLRLFIGEKKSAGEEADEVWVLETNLDDIPSELIGYCFDQLFAAGALDVFSTPIQMKKNRPGVLLSVLCSEEKIAELEAILFRETATFGIRRYPAQRHKLRRETSTVQTPWGPIRGKIGRRDGLTIFTPEYEDCARVARERGIPLREVYDRARRGSHE